MPLYTPIRPLLRPSDAARLLGVSMSTLRRMTETGRLPPPVRISDRRLGYRPADIESLIQGEHNATREGVSDA